jgi:hypothetical protein
MLQNPTLSGRRGGGVVDQHAEGVCPELGGVSGDAGARQDEEIICEGMAAVASKHGSVVC